MTLDIDLDALSGDHATEIGRILRYWGGAMKQLDLTQPLRARAVGQRVQGRSGLSQLS